MVVPRMPTQEEIDRLRWKVRRTTYGGRYSRDRKRHRRPTFQCLNQHCRKFVPRPSAVCAVCGNDPVPLPGHVNERHYRDLFDEEHGWNPYENDRR